MYCPRTHAGFIKGERAYGQREAQLLSPEFKLMAYNVALARHGDHSVRSRGILEDIGIGPRDKWDMQFRRQGHIGSPRPWSNGHDAARAYFRTTKVTLASSTDYEAMQRIIWTYWIL